MKDILCGHFQETVNDTLIRHRSILDIMSKLQESNARVNRALSKAITACGCVQIKANKQQIPEDISVRDLHKYMENHFDGRLCEHCKEVLETELGSLLFYLAGLCNTVGLNMYDIFLKEQKKLRALGVFNFS